MPTRLPLRALVRSLSLNYQHTITQIKKSAAHRNAWKANRNPPQRISLGFNSPRLKISRSAPSLPLAPKPTSLLPSPEGCHRDT